MYILIGSIIVLGLIYFVFNRRRRRKNPPNSPTQLKLYLSDMRYYNMASVNVSARWVKSVSPDVVSQELVVFINNEIHDVLELGKDTEQAILEDIPERSQLKVELTAFDGVFKSTPAIAILDIPDLAAPEAPTNLVLEIPTV